MPALDKNLSVARYFVFALNIKIHIFCRDLKPIWKARLEPDSKSGHHNHSYHRNNCYSPAPLNLISNDSTNYLGLPFLNCSVRGTRVSVYSDFNCRQHSWALWCYDCLFPCIYNLPFPTHGRCLVCRPNFHAPRCLFVVDWRPKGITLPVLTGIYRQLYFALSMMKINY